MTSCNGETPTLKYQFSAMFEDGMIIDQYSDDKSTIDPMKSAFYDVLEYEKKSRLKSFALVEMDGQSGKVFGVDLLTGMFGLDGNEFNIADQLFEPEAPLKLIYFREMRVEMLVGDHTGEKKGERMYINRYFIGWETTWKGKKYQRTIALQG